jgi:5-methylcytosine-specific restriction endonuclease McrA
VKIDRKKVFKKYDGQCAYCGCSISIKSFNVDHLIPIQKGGSDEMENLMPSCRSCNSWKAAWLIEDFRNVISDQVDMLDKYGRNWKLAYRFGLVRKTHQKVIFFFEEYSL